MGYRRDLGSHCVQEAIVDRSLNRVTQDLPYLARRLDHDSMSPNLAVSLLCLKCLETPCIGHSWNTGDLAKYQPNPLHM